MAPYYESNRGVSEYLLFHYGKPGGLAPISLAPSGAFEFPVRCVQDCLDPERLPEEARALDLGCAVGRSSFELARHCASVVGIDYSRAFVKTAERLRSRGSVSFSVVEEGELTLTQIARVSTGVDRSRVRFERGDAMNLRASLGSFDVVLMANLIDRLPDPRRCLRRLPALVNPGGQLIITSPYTWLPEYTPRSKWLGGRRRAGRSVRTADALLDILSPDFSLVRRRDLPFVIREHARKFQLGIAEATIWRRAAR